MRAQSAEQGRANSRGGAVALVIGDDLAALLLPDADATVSGTEVDAHGGAINLLIRHGVR